ncbi:MAG: hypothetical protein IK086_03755 [Clostridia bacterium]|nr:hypothetical protein [Clostridia bacterium]
MRGLRITVCILTVVAIIATVLLRFRSAKMNIKPVIVCSVPGTIEVKSDATDAELLKFVTATDTQDGDITDKIIVERQNYFVEKGVTVVNFAVCDSDNNVSKIAKYVKFTDYHSPHFTLNSDFLVYARTNIDFSNIVGAEDVYDGDISAYVKIISNTYNNAYAGLYDVNCKVTNSFGDISEISFKAIVVDDDPNVKKVKLNNYIYYTGIGEVPDFNENILDMNGSSTKNLTIDQSEFNPEAPGVYSVYYKISDQIRARVIIVVQEAEDESN